MKSIVCVPSENSEGWDAPVGDHFSLAPWFALVQGTEIEWVDARASMDCNDRSELLARHGATIVLTKAASASNVQALQAKDILVLECQSPTLRQAILSLMMGGVVPLGKTSCCGKHDHAESPCAHNP